MDINKLALLSEEFLKLAKKYNAPRKGMKSRWSTKYKSKINCSNPKGFSQKAYCARKRRGGGYKDDVNDAAWIDKSIGDLQEFAKGVSDSFSKKVDELKKSFLKEEISPQEMKENLNQLKLEGKSKIRDLSDKAKSSPPKSNGYMGNDASSIEKYIDDLAKSLKNLGYSSEKLNSEFKPQNPIKGSYFSSGGYGQISPKKFHSGVDLRPASGEGTPLYPIESGVVTKITSESQNPSGGKSITIKHNDNVHTSYYAHMKDINVKPGDTVNKDTVIGTIGTTGNAKGTVAHVHLQISENGSVQDPARYIYVPSYTNYDPSKEKSIDIA